MTTVHKDIINPEDFILLTERIGNGAQADVFKTIEKKTNELFVAKVYNSHFEYTPKNKMLLESEINVMRRLNHPLIVKFIGFSPVDFHKQSRPIIFLEYMKNGSIDTQLELKRKGKAEKEWDKTRELICIYGISATMKYLQSQGIIHRDIKPRNILLDENFNPKISDFGLCKILRSDIGLNKDSNGGTVGSPYWIAPELWEDEPKYSEKSDVYAFAITVYEIITGQTPFNSIHSIHKLMKEVTKGSRPKFNTEIPESYKNLIERCWDQDPNKRPTFEQITQELREDPGFITSSIDADKYHNFIEKIDESEINFSISKSNIMLDEFIKNEPHCFSDSETFEKSEDTIELSPGPIKPEDMNADDLLKLADKYFNGDDVSIDKKEGIHYYKLAADKGNVIAMHKYGNILNQGNGIDIDKKESARYYKMAADKGFIKSMISYGLMLYFDDGIEIDEKEAVRYFKLAADKDNTNGIYFYGFALISGKGIQEDLRKGAEYLKIAADRGKIEAMSRYANMLEIGLGIPSDKKEAAKYYKQAADKGHEISMYQYAVMLEIGDGIKQNKAKAAEYYKKAADKGHINSMYLYAQMAINGEGIEMNEKEAAKYFKMAADKNNIDAKFNYGCLLITGRGVKKNPAKGIELIRDIAEQGDMDAVNLYAVELYAGENVQQNKNLAAKYFKLAANNGNVDSMAFYAIMLKEGEGGVKINLQESVRYFKMAADKGNVASMLQYGLMRDRGEGVKADPQIATQYIRKAADSGNPDAMYLYGIRLKNGQGVQINREKSESYIKRAAEMGSQDAKDFLNRSNCIIA